MLGFSPESTDCMLSMNIAILSRGANLDTYFTTSWSLLNAYAKTYRLQNRAMLTMADSAAARATATRVANRAGCGFPAPNSFDTRMLQKISVHRNNAYATCICF